MSRYSSLFTYIGIAAIIVLLIGLAGWYFFLRNQTGGIQDLGAARGFDIAVPSFTGSRSSTAENITLGAGAESLLAVTENQERPPRLWKVSNTPVAGFGLISGSTTIRYIERSTGHIYDVNPETGTAVRLTNELVPKVYDAHVVGTTSVVMRILTDEGVPITLIGQFGTTSEDGFRNIGISNLGETVSNIAPSPTRPEFVMLAAGSDGSTHVVRSRDDGSSPQQLLSLGVGSFSLQWLSDQRLFLTELPGSSISGSAFEVIQGTLVPMLRNIPGLMITPRATSGALLFSVDDGERVRLFVRLTAESPATEIPLQTIAHKCVWAPPSTSTSTPTLAAYCAIPQSALPKNFLDQWMRGAVHTSDVWFTLDASAAKSDKFFTPETSVALDVERPAIDTFGSYITFMNARDKSLWVLRVAE